MRELDGAEIYFRDATETAIHDTEMYLEQNRRARAQESFNTARYFSAKLKPGTLSEDYVERLEKLRLTIW